MSSLAPYDKQDLPAGVVSRFIEEVNGLRMHILEAGNHGSTRPIVLLLHGFPELAYSWRKVMPALAGAGYHVIAPDQRGYGRTTGWSNDYNTDISSFRMINLVRDILCLLDMLEHPYVEAIIGHDFGAHVAAYASLIRPDIFRAMVLMSAPFPGAPNRRIEAKDPIHKELANLSRPRKHYQWYYSTAEANQDMHRCPQGVDRFLRGYFHQKSADWTGNTPFALTAWTAEQLAQLPTYYIMDLNEDMAATVAKEMPTAGHVKANEWLPERELIIYAKEYERTGFQGGLNWYRCRTGGTYHQELDMFFGSAIKVPSYFIAGESDWGVYQIPDALEKMQTIACQDFRGLHLVPNAGHWVQQEQPNAVINHLLTFFDGLR